MPTTFIWEAQSFISINGLYNRARPGLHCRQRSQVRREVLCHLDALEATIAKDLDHSVVWVEEPLVMGVLQVVQLDVSPE